MKSNLFNSTVKFLFAAAFLLASCFVHAQFAPVGQAKGYWHMSGVGAIVVDSTPNHLDGFLTGEAAFQGTPESGDISMFGETARIVLPASPLFQANTGTLSIWVNSAGQQTADLVWMNTGGLIRRQNFTTFPVFGLRILSTGQVSGYVADDDPALSQPWKIATTRGGLIKPGAWHMITLRWDGSAVSVLVDGRWERSEPYVAIPVEGLSYYGLNPLTVGGMTNLGGAHRTPYAGQVRDLAFFDRALSDSEVFQLFQSSK